MPNTNRGLDEFMGGDPDQSPDAQDSEATDHDHDDAQDSDDDRDVLFDRRDTDADDSSDTQDTDDDDDANPQPPDAPAFVDGLESLDYYLTTGDGGHFVMGTAYRRAKAHGTDPTAICGEVVANDASASLLAALLKAAVHAEDGLSPDPDDAGTLYPAFVLTHSDVGPDLCAACHGRYTDYYMEVSVNKQARTDQFQAYLTDDHDTEQDDA